MSRPAVTLERRPELLHEGYARSQFAISNGSLASARTANCSYERVRGAIHARHNILPQTEHFPIAKVNDAVQHLLDGKARYRVVLDM